MAVPALYVLSFGPMNWDGRMGEDTFMVVYWPILKVLEVVPESAVVLNWYVNLWQPEWRGYSLPPDS